MEGGEQWVVMEHIMVTGRIGDQWLAGASGHGKYSVFNSHPGAFKSGGQLKLPVGVKLFM